MLRCTILFAHAFHRTGDERQIISETIGSARTRPKTITPRGTVRGMAAGFGGDGDQVDRLPQHIPGTPAGRIPPKGRRHGGVQAWIRGYRDVAVDDPGDTGLGDGLAGWE